MFFPSLGSEGKRKSSTGEPCWGMSTALEILGVTVLIGDSDLSGVLDGQEDAPGRQLAWAWMVSFWW